jgi:glycosyltransferase involved in cell wall biosynthesis
MQESAAIRCLERVEMFLYRKAARIVSVTESFRQTLIRRGIDGSKIEVVTNGVDIARFQPMAKDAELVARHGLQGKFVAGYIGTHGMAHALETILAAAERLQHEGDDTFRFILLGDGARKPALKEQAQAKGLINVLFVDSVAKGDVPRYWSLLDVSIIHLKKTELFTTVIPSKLFEGMGMGIPVLHGVAGESAEIVEREGAGLVFEPENVEALLAGLRRFRDDAEFYQRCRENALAGAKNYGRAELAARMLRVLERTAAG